MTGLTNLIDETWAEAESPEAGLDAAPEKVFDDLTWLASRACAAPVAVMSLKGEHGRWLKSKVGLTPQETAHVMAFCEEVLAKGSLHVAEDVVSNGGAMRDSARPRLRFFAGVSLVLSDGSAAGTLCVMDRVPRELCRDQAYALEVLARQMVNQLERRAA